MAQEASNAEASPVAAGPGMALGSILRARRDDNVIRRRGTGRATTKRTFAFKLASLVPGLVGRKTGLPLKQNGKRDSNNLDNVSDFWRDSIESAQGTDTPLGTAAVEPPAHSPHPPVVPTPGTEAHAATVPHAHAAEPVVHEPIDDEPVADEQVDDEPVDDEPVAPEAPSGNPTPFRRANKLMRTPAGPPVVPEPEEEEEEEAAAEEEAVEEEPDVRAPVALSFDADEGGAPEEEEEEAPAPPSRRNKSMGTSPINFSEPRETRSARARRSMGTSPISAPPAGTSTSPAASVVSGPLSDAGGADGGMDDMEDAGLPEQDDFDDEPAAPPPPPPMADDEAEAPVTAAPKPRRPKGSRKTSLDKLGRLPPAVAAAVLEGEGEETNRRKGKRQRHAPLEYWRGERPVYDRRASAKFPCIVDFIEVERDPTPKWAAKRKAAAKEAEDAAKKAGIARPPAKKKKA